MNIPRFRIETAQASEESFLLDPEESRHAMRVLRLKAGDAVQLFDGRGGVWSGLVLAAEGSRVRVLPGKNQPFTERGAAIELGVALIRPERMDWMVQKACELGVSAVHPLETRRVIVRIPKDKAESRRKRWAKIASESCKQCGLSVLPQISIPRPLQDYIADLPPYDMILLPTLARPGRPFRQALEEHAPRGRVLVLIGPEGDFTQDEVDACIARGAEPVDLGGLVLRSETAAIYMMSCLKFYFEGKSA